jgi:hypothetical protein
VTQTTEAPAGLDWLRETLGGMQRQITSLRMRTAALESELEIRDRREAELRAQLEQAEAQLDGSASQMREGIKADVLEDLVLLGNRTKALATCLVVLAAHEMGQGVDSLSRLGLPDDVVSLVRLMASPARPSPVESVQFLSGADGIRYSPEPPAAQQYSSPPHSSNRISYTAPVTKKDKEDREFRDRDMELQGRVRTSSVQEQIHEAAGKPMPPPYRRLSVAEPLWCGRCVLSQGYCRVPQGRCLPGLCGAALSG